jgi:tRNA(fMet)-specific endonuclease VapC
MSYLVDTDWVIDYLKGVSTAVHLLDSLAHEGLYISLITYGEIYEGIYYGKNTIRHDQVFQHFLQGVSVLALSEDIMREFARIRGQLRSKGQMIGDADILIGATAIHHEMTLLTQNIRHFERIPHLQLYQS